MHVADATGWKWTAPDVAALDNGGFAMTWRDGRANSNSGRLQILDADGNSVHGPISFGGAAPSNENSNDHNLTKVIQLENGTLATSYESDGTWYVQRWNHDGTELGAAFAISNSGVVAETNVQLTAVGDGFMTTFVAADADGRGVYTRLFNSDGSAAGEPILINDTTTGDQQAPVITELGNGSVNVAWSSNLNGDTDIYQKTLTFGQQVGENAQPGTVVGQVNATDPDGDAVTFSLIDDAGGRFAIDPNTGVVTVASVLDYESAPSHQLQVRATDARGHYSDQLYVVGVKDNEESYQPATLTFNDSGGGYADIQEMNSFGYYRETTVEMWVKPGTTEVEAPFTFEMPTLGGYSDDLQVIFRPSLGKAVVYVGGYSSDKVIVDMPELFDGEWHHFAFSWHKDNDGEVKTYLDGNLVDAAYDINTGYLLSGISGLVLGQEADTRMGGYDADQAYTGEMRDFRVWNEARSEAGIQAEMHNPDVTGSNLVAHYKLDGDTRDSSGKGNHLTPKNLEWATEGTDAAESIHDSNYTTGDNILIGGGGADAFIWQADDLGTVDAPAEDIIRDFQSGTGGDVIDLSDVLIGEESNELDQYLSFNFANGDSTIEIRSEAGGGIVQKVKLEGVDLSGLGSTDADIINQLISDGNLRLDE